MQVASHLRCLLFSQNAQILRVVFIRLGGLLKNLLAVSGLYSPKGLEEKYGRGETGT